MEAMENSFKKLNREQLDAVTTLDGAVLVTAGAGSGKTRVLTLRIANLIKQGKANINQILAITFTNKAANEMKERVINLIGEGYGLNISTFHSFCASFLRDNISAVEGYTSRFTIYGDDEKNKLIKEVCKDLTGVSEDFAKNLAYHLSNMKNQNLTPFEYCENYLKLDSYKNDFERSMIEYQLKLKQNNAFDFDDLLTFTYSVLKNNPQILEYYQNKFKYISIDEFQDTNTVQYDIAKILALKHKNILVVGDEDQCIYGWRGANIQNISNFIKDFSPKVIKLEQNYRSTKRIINYANKIIRNNTQRLDKELRTENDLGEEPVYYNADTETMEADYVARNILSLVKNGGYKFKDCAVLMRLNALSRSFEERFMAYNIPYKLYGGFKFFERAEIKGTLAYLRLIDNPRDGDAFSRLCGFPKRKIGEATINTFKEYCFLNNLTLLDGILNIKDLDLSNAVKNKIAVLTPIFEILQEKYEKNSLIELFENAISVTGISNQYLEQTEENINKMRNLEALLSSVKEFEELNSEQATLQKYLETVTLANDIDNLDEENNQVVLSTIHAVKGLEFKCVFVVGLEDGAFPLSRALNDFNEMEEERRLMYVALTRAEEKLYLTKANSRYMYGERKYMSASHFLKELGFENMFKSYKNESGDFDGSQHFSNAGVKDVKSMFINNLKTQPKNTNGMFVSNGTNVEFAKFKVGAKVTHPKFGDGVIADTSELESKKTVKIDFEDFGVKNLIVGFAPIEFID